MTKTKFEKLLGNSPKTKVIQYFQIGKGFNYSIRDVVGGTGLTYNVCEKAIKSLMDQRVIKKVSVGKTHTYTFDSSTHKARHITRLFNAVIKED